MLNLIEGQPQAGMTFPNCTSPALNLAVPLASLAAGEPGACIGRNEESWKEIASFFGTTDGFSDLVRLKHERENRLKRAARVRRQRGEL